MWPEARCNCSRAAAVRRCWCCIMTWANGMVAVLHGVGGKPHRLRALASGIRQVGAAQMGAQRARHRGHLPAPAQGPGPEFDRGGGIGLWRMDPGRDGDHVPSRIQSPGAGQRDGNSAQPRRDHGPVPDQHAGLRTGRIRRPGEIRGVVQGTARCGPVGDLGDQAARCPRASRGNRTCSTRRCRI